MPQTQIFVKEELVNKTLVIDLTSYLNAGELPVSSVYSSPVPASLPPIVLTSATVSANSLTSTASGGVAGISYGINVSVTTNLPRTFTFLIAVQVLVNSATSITSRNPNAFQNLVGELEAGEAAVGRAVFVLDKSVDPSLGSVVWSVLDNLGKVYSAGNTYSYTFTPNAFNTIVEAEGLVNIPSSTQPTLDGQSYQVRWVLTIPGMPDQYTSESLRVPGRTTMRLGATDAIELVGDPVSLSLLLSRPWDFVGLELFQANNARVSVTNAKPSETREASGWRYSSNISTTGMLPDLVPYQVSWKYYNSQTPGQVNRESSKVFILNLTILTAVEDIRMQVMKARTVLTGEPDLLFDTSTIVSWMRRGRDLFNSAGGVFTHFNMREASGGIREFWLRYSEVSMLQAQALAEGEKAFDFQGQAISLSVDKAQYYTALADAIRSQLDNDIRSFKQALKTSGITSGTGNLDSIRSYNVPQLGIAVTPASTFVRGFGLRGY